MAFCVRCAAVMISELVSLSADHGGSTAEQRGGAADRLGLREKRRLHRRCPPADATAGVGGILFCSGTTGAAGAAELFLELGRHRFRVGEFQHSHPRFGAGIQRRIQAGQQRLGALPLPRCRR